MRYVLIAFASLVATILFDFVYFKIEQKIELEKSWKALNEKLEKEGRPRLDGRDKNKKSKK